MAEVEFIYVGINTIIQCLMNEPMKEIIKKFKIKRMIEGRDDLIFLYDGKILNMDLSFMDIANNIDKERKKMNIIVNSGDHPCPFPNFKLSEYIICPQCYEKTSISITDYKIFLNECKNGHKKDNIYFDEFKETQKIDESKIICDICKEHNKRDIFKNQIFICSSCNKLLCPLCKHQHNKEHHIIDFDYKDFICKKHYESFISYCKNCKQDLCLLCIKEHHGHEMINYGDIIPDINIVKDEFNEFDNTIIKFKKYIDELVLKLKKLKDNLDNYHQIYDNIIKNFDQKKINYNIINNINYLNDYNDDLKNILDEILNKKDIKNKLNDIMLIYYKMTFRNNENDDNNESDEEKIYAINQNKNRIKKAFNTKEKISNLYILNDGRIFVITQKDFSNYNKYIYNISNDVFVCDIYKEDNEKIEQMIQISNNIVILLTTDKLKVLQIKKHSLDEIQSIDISDSKIIGKNCKKISNEKICVRDDKCFKFYDFKDNKLQKSKIEFKFPMKSEKITDFCVINENEIAIHYDEDSFFGNTAFLMFFDIKNNEQIKTLKLIYRLYRENANDINDICLINDNYLSINYYDGFRIIYIKNGKLIEEIYSNLIECHLFQLNLNFLCLYNRSVLQIFEFENNGRIKKYKYNRHINDNIKICRLFSDKFIIIEGDTKIKIYQNYINFVEEKK